MIEASKLARLDTQSIETASSEEVICNICNKPVPSRWHLPSTRHSCKDDIKEETVVEEEKGKYKCENCNVVLKTVWHLSRHVCNPNARAGNEITVYDCRICASVFETFSDLSTHYTREHFWSELENTFL